jgi:hypothetical protein
MKYKSLYNTVEIRPEMSQAAINFAALTVINLKKVITPENKELVVSLIRESREIIKSNRSILFIGGASQGLTSKYSDPLLVKLQAIKRSLSVIRNRRYALRAISTENKKFGPYTYTVTGGIFTKPGSILDIKPKYHPKYAREAKVPRENSISNYIGVELEMESDIDLKEMAVLLAEHKLCHKVRVVSDGSLDTENLEHTFELNVLDTEENINNTLDKLHKLLNETSYEFSVNSTCGTHIHFDMRQRDVETCYNRLFHGLDTLLETVNDDRHDNDYCSRNVAATMETAKKKYPSEKGARYQMINPMSYGKHKTLEVRVFHGTTDMEEVKNWIKMSLNIMNTPKQRAKRGA